MLLSPSAHKLSQDWECKSVIMVFAESQIIFKASEGSFDYNFFPDCCAKATASIVLPQAALPGGGNMCITHTGIVGVGFELLSL